MSALKRLPAGLGRQNLRSDAGGTGLLDRRSGLFKSEIRRPKAERSQCPKSESTAAAAQQEPILSSYSRISDFGFPSGLGFRPSDFRAAGIVLSTASRTLKQPLLAARFGRDRGGTGGRISGNAMLWLIQRQLKSKKTASRRKAVERLCAATAPASPSSSRTDRRYQCQVGGRAGGVRGIGTFMNTWSCEMCRAQLHLNRPPSTP